MNIKGELTKVQSDFLAHHVCVKSDSADGSTRILTQGRVEYSNKTRTSCTLTFGFSFSPQYDQFHFATLPFDVITNIRIIGVDAYTSRPTEAPWVDGVSRAEVLLNNDVVASVDYAEPTNETDLSLVLPFGFLRFQQMTIRLYVVANPDIPDSYFSQSFPPLRTDRWALRVEGGNVATIDGNEVTDPSQRFSWIDAESDMMLNPREG